MEEINELITFCVNNDISIEDYVRELIKILVTEYNLQKYLQYLGFQNDSKLSILDILSISAYDMTNDGIIVFKNDFEKVAVNKAKEINMRNRLFKQFKFYLITQAILHEIEHVKQKKMVKGYVDINNLEYKLVYLTLRHLYEEYPRYLDKETITKYQDKIESIQFAYYNSNPTERLAEIRSNKTMIDLVTEEQIKKFFEKELNEKILRGYTSEINSPTVYFFRNMSKGDIFSTCGIYKGYISYLSYLKNLDFYDNNDEIMLEKSIKLYGLNERLFYGLPISGEEYKSLQKK